MYPHFECQSTPIKHHKTPCIAIYSMVKSHIHPFSTGEALRRERTVLQPRFATVHGRHHLGGFSWRLAAGAKGLEILSFPEN